MHGSISHRYVIERVSNAQKQSFKQTELWMTLLCQRAKVNLIQRECDLFVSHCCVIEDLMHGHSHASSPLPSGARADCDTLESVKEMRLDETYSRANGMLGIRISCSKYACGINIVKRSGLAPSGSSYSTEYRMDITCAVAARDMPCSSLKECWLKGDDALQNMGFSDSLIVCCTVESSVFSS